MSRPANDARRALRDKIGRSLTPGDESDVPRDVLLVVPTMGERLDLLEICLDSLRAQSHPCRVTVVAGGGTADEMAARYRGYPRMTVAAERSRGLSAAINQGWRDDDWRSDFVGWLGDDDALPPWSIESAVEVLVRRERASMVHGRCLVIDEVGEPIRLTRNGRAAALLSGFGMNLIAQPGSLFRTTAVRAVGGLDETLRFAMDVDLYVRLRRVGPIATASRQLGVFREHVTGLSTAQRSAAAQEARMVQRRVYATPVHRVADHVVLPVSKVIAAATARLSNQAVAWRPGPPSS